MRALDGIEQADGDSNLGRDEDDLAGVMLPREPRQNSYRRGYTKAWSAYAKTWKQAHPLCGERADGRLHAAHSRCVRDGRTSAVAVTDHITPHRGNPALFWDESNHQSLCASCHNAKSQTERT
jgi:5-methylcytosine-specific restriction protein A